ncbi:MAG: hypothetical protein M1829_000292 [Trizodia sp. TS-e1964]|nr:MAG: hypothetical protein M1829_000292 [Trizodia sp. TS-e1964]
MFYIAAVSVLFAAANIVSAGPIGIDARNILPDTQPDIFSHLPSDPITHSHDRRAAQVPSVLDPGYIRSLSADELKQLRVFLYTAHLKDTMTLERPDDLIGEITTEVIKAIGQVPTPIPSAKDPESPATANDDVYYYLQNLMFYVSRQPKGYGNYKALFASLCAETLPAPLKIGGVSKSFTIDFVRNLSPKQLNELAALLYEAYDMEVAQGATPNPSLDQSIRAAISLIDQAFKAGRVNDPQALFDSLDQLRQEVDKTPGEHSAFKALFANL